MNMKTVVIVTFVFFRNLHKYGIGACYVTLEASTDIIHPGFLKSLELRCSIQNYSIDSPEGQSFNRSVSPEVHLEQLLSVVIFSVNAKGENETIASVTGCSTPVIEKSFLNIVQAEGSSEESPEKNEQGYLRLTWDRPNGKQAANYACEVSFLNSIKHSDIISTSLNIVSFEPKISDLVTYILDNERTIQQLTRRIDELQNCTDVKKELGELHKYFNSTSEIINNRLDNMKAQNSQTGELACVLNNVNHVTFSRPFKKVPTVNLMLSVFNLQDFRNTLTYVNATGFGVNCNRVSTDSLYFKWLAIDL